MITLDLLDELSYKFLKIIIGYFLKQNTFLLQRKFLESNWCKINGPIFIYLEILPFGSPQSNWDKICIEFRWLFNGYSSFKCIVHKSNHLKFYKPMKKIILYFSKFSFSKILFFKEIKIVPSGIAYYNGLP